MRLVYEEFGVIYKFKPEFKPEFNLILRTVENFNLLFNSISMRA